jgi:group II intron reverse transcriptase/maturase
LGNLEKPQDKVQNLRSALHAKAKAEPEFRFYALYDKLYRKDVLTEAYKRCKANGGVAGVDGQTFKAISEEYGEERWIGELADRLRMKDYRQQAVRRVWIPKPNGKKRPLGIPTITDRVVQTATMLVLEPIFEADLQPEQYAYRPDRGALEAIVKTHSLINMGHKTVIEADLADFFGSIPHPELMKCVARRVIDGQILHLIKMWLTAPVEEEDAKGNRTRSNPGKNTKRGTPQGAPISPLLSNLYMRRFILGWKRLCAAKGWEAAIVNYADDFVICCKSQADEAMAAMREMMQRLKLTVNDAKTHLTCLPEQRLEFLGYQIGRCYSKKTGKAYIGTRPSRKSVSRTIDKIRDITARNMTVLEADDVIGRLNRLLTGWANYFRLGQVSPAYKMVDLQATRRLRRWFSAKHKVKLDYRTYSDSQLREHYGLVSRCQTTKNLPWAKA